MPTPASADHISCWDRFACIWAGTQWQSDGDHDRWVAFERYIPDYDDWHYGEQTGGQSNYTAWRNASSMSNQGNVETAFFFANAHCNGNSWSWASNTGDKDLSNGPAGSNNAFGSGAFTSFKDDCA